MSAGSTLELCPLEQEFNAFISSRKPPYRSKIFQHRCVKEIIARLHPSRIPPYPLDEKGAEAISDALQAWRMYSLLAACLSNSDKDFRAEYLAHFSHAWQWALFLLPGEGNVKDLRGLDFQTPRFPLRHDGTVAATVYMRYRMLMIALVALLDDPARRAICQRLPRFGEVFLALVSYEWPRPRDDDLASLIHNLMRTLRAGTTRKDDFSNQMIEDIRAHEARHPGSLLRAVFLRFVWLLDSGQDELDAEERSVYGQHYSFVIMQSLGSGLHDTIYAGFRGNGGASVLVKVLLRAVPHARTEEELKEKVRNEPTIQRIIARLAMSVMDGVLVLRDTDDVVAEAINAGLLVVIGRMRRLLHGAAAVSEQGGIRTSGDRWLNNAIIPAMARARVLRALLENHDNLFLKELCDKDHEPWPALTTAAERFESLFPPMLLFIDNVDEARKKGCSNPQCQHAGAPRKKMRLKMCSCADVLYCSRECQKIHWRSGGHREACSNEANKIQTITRPLKDPNGNPIPTSVGPHLSYYEYHFLRLCALHEISLLYKSGKARDRVEYTVELPNLDGIKTYKAELPYTLEPRTIRVVFKANWGAGLEMTIAIPRLVTFSELQDVLEQRKITLGIYA
ncbi:uncharacterized protein SCHCODRAFT_02554498 [Schizophyllum commune H4-8]|uniref:uncharacterized protein n=1 Tax=Schizophyllum commune (strain H4-8 / FGSC 9210) TaxID=578458 RepID=UPI00215F3D6E|nr:uncharacterized protein SCHCODRAFT_02554498 [Schizophyllum commune H4-8]KAI5887109.1 hypothetical protein SCHCODRAFT_02554498 [Schizophyllum commune H4-8]